MRMSIRPDESGSSLRKVTAYSCSIVFTLFAHGAEIGLETVSVPEGFSVELAAGPDLTSYPMFMAFDYEGRLFIAESTGKDLSGQEMADAPECLILLLEDLDGDQVFDKRTVFADTLSLPMGVLWHEGSLYVASPPAFYRFEDVDGDGVADEREVLLTGWNVRNTASLHGPFLGPDGRLYLTHGRHGYKIETKEGELLEGLAARIWRCRTDGTELERFAGGGFDNPVELIFTGAGEMIGTMTYFTNPQYGQRDALLHFAEGGVYPKFHDCVDEFTRTGDLMPVMTKFSRIAPAGLVQYRSSAFVPDYRGNLFSAQFNPHRVQRHVLIREGATYRTEDSDFLTSTSPDFYPTDIVEDADGSLLVCDTGAWYVDACPISRVAKPEIRGSVYRVRRAGAAEVEDPWGKRIGWEDRLPEQLSVLLADPRPKVRDRALRELVSRSRAAIDSLAALVRGSASEEASLGAVSALWQIGGESALPPLREALDSRFAAVQVAGAQALGDLRDAVSVDRLVNLVATGSAPQRCAAATALGRIGDSTATAPLLKACATADDRFVEHALIYAMMQIGNLEPLEELLGRGGRAPVARSGEYGAPGVRRAALVALDQMRPEAVEAEILTSFLVAPDAALRKTGLWVASRHPEMADEVLQHLRGWLFEGRLDPAEAEGARDVLLAYVNEDACRTLLAEMLSLASATWEREEMETDLRLFALDIMDRAPLAEFPEAWRTEVGKLLGASAQAVRRRALDLIGARDLAGFERDLAVLAEDAQEPPAFRLAALGALIASEPMLDGERLRLVLDSLGQGNEATLRQAAAKLLARGELALDAKRRLAEEMLPTGDTLMVTALIDACEGDSDESLGMKVVQGLQSNPLSSELLRPARVEKLFASFPPSVRQAGEPLLARALERDEALVQRFTKLEPLLGSGDVGRGRRVFFGDKVACSTCHAIGEEGGNLGPDLTSIGLVRSGHDLLEAVLFPSASFDQDYVPYRVDTENEIFTGILVRESTEAVVLKTGVGEEKHVPRESIVSMSVSGVSFMPDGLDAGLEDEDLVDLVTFLQSLNNETWLLPELRESANRQ